MGSILFSYFCRRYLVMTLQIFAGLAVLAYLIDLAELSRQMNDKQEFTFLTGMVMSAYRIPQILTTAIPFVILVSAIAALMNFNRRYELVVARSAGVSAWQFLAPLCLTSLVIGIVALLILDPIAAWTFSRAEIMEAELRGRSAASTSQVRIPWLRQVTDEGVAIIGATNSAQRGKLLFNATFIRFDENDEIRDRLDAERAALLDGEWELDNVTIYRGGADRYSVDTMRIKSGLKAEFIEDQLARPEAIPFFELGRKIEVARSFGLNASGFLTQYHARLATPLLLVAMTLIAATISLRFARFGQSATMILGGIMAGFLLYVVTVLAKAFGSAGIVPPVIAAWIPVILAMFYGVTFLLYKEDG